MYSAKDLIRRATGKEPSPKYFSEYVEKLRTTPDGDGSLLDHTTILYGAGMSEGNGHVPEESFEVPEVEPVVSVPLTLTLHEIRSFLPIIFKP